ALAPREAQAYDPGEDEMRARYRETDHIKAYYRVNRYPEKK
ncbi:formate dehydrogenase, partial [Mesorhizobium sp. M7A.F.Ca.US.002.01.1.1]